MIKYIMLGTNDLERSIAFYDPLLKELGAARAFTTDSMAAWSFGKDATMLCVTRPFNEQSAAAGNGVMVALGVESAEIVDRLHASALESGATDEGSPGPRGASFYGSYFRDPDGNKLNFCSTCEASRSETQELAESRRATRRPQARRTGACRARRPLLVLAAFASAPWVRMRLCTENPECCH